MNLKLVYWSITIYIYILSIYCTGVYDKQRTLDDAVIVYDRNPSALLSLSIDKVFEAVNFTTHISILLTCDPVEHRDFTLDIYYVLISGDSQNKAPV